MTDHSSRRGRAHRSRAHHGRHSGRLVASVQGDGRREGRVEDGPRAGEAARRAWFGLIRAYGEDAPGPPEWRLRLPPEPSILAGLPYYVYHPYGVERRRADLIRRVSSRAAWFEGIADLPLPQAYARLTAVPRRAIWRRW